MNIHLLLKKHAIISHLLTYTRSSKFARAVTKPKIRKLDKIEEEEKKNFDVKSYNN